MINGRSRKGAWIEIYERGLSNDIYFSRSRKGAWIEIMPAIVLGVSCAASLP